MGIQNINQVFTFTNIISLLKRAAKPVSNLFLQLIGYKPGNYIIINRYYSQYTKSEYIFLQCSEYEMYIKK